MTGTGFKVLTGQKGINVEFLDGEKHVKVRVGSQRVSDLCVVLQKNV